MGYTGHRASGTDQRTIGRANDGGISSNNSVLALYFFSFVLCIPLFFLLAQLFAPTSRPTSFYRISNGAHRKTSNKCVLYVSAERTYKLKLVSCCVVLLTQLITLALQSPIGPAAQQHFFSLNIVKWMDAQQEYDRCTSNEQTIHFIQLDLIACGYLKVNLICLLMNLIFVRAMFDLS